MGSPRLDREYTSFHRSNVLFSKPHDTVILLQYEMYHSNHAHGHEEESRDYSQRRNIDLSMDFR